MNKNKASNIKAILAERGSNYGSFDGHSVITQGIKLVMARDWESLQSLLDSLREYDPTPDEVISSASQQEALDMIAHKIGRIINGNPYYTDSWVDIAGYAQLIVDELEADEGKVTKEEPLEEPVEIGDKFGVKVKLAASSNKPLEAYYIEECTCPKCTNSALVTVRVYKDGKAIVDFTRAKKWSARMHKYLNNLAEQIDSLSITDVHNKLADLGLVWDTTDLLKFSNDTLINTAHSMVDYSGTKVGLETYLKHTNGQYPDSQQEMIDNILELVGPADVLKSASVEVFFNELMEIAKKQNK